MSLWRRSSEALGKAIVGAIAAAIVAAAVTLLSLAAPPIRTFMVASYELPGFLITLVAGLVAAGAASVWLLLGQASLLKEEASTDHQLNVLNSRECGRRLEEAIAEADRYGHPFSIGLVDVDGLKAANDAHGYSAEDQLLREFVQLAKGRLRKTDVLFRYRQGDEFLILFKGTEAGDARTPSEGVRRIIGDYKFQGRRPGDFFGITISIGVVGYDPRETGIDVEALCRRAEAALAVAKQTKNATWLATGSKPAD